MSFPFPDVTLCPFSRINLSLSPTCATKSPNLGVVLRSRHPNKGLLGPNSSFCVSAFHYRENISLDNMSEDSYWPRLIVAGIQEGTGSS